MATAVIAALVVGAGGVALAEAAKEWSYEGETGPSHWASLGYEKCDTGKRQSPIDLRNPSHGAAPAIVTRYVASPLTETNSGHTVEVSSARDQTLVVGGKSYKLVQFHFHLHSEHAVKGAFSPLEIHFVHRAADGARAVVGVLVKAGAANTTFGRLVKTVPAAKGDTVLIATATNPVGLMPASRRAYRYNGSLTTPPCDEGLKWYVLAKRITASRAQLDALHKVVHDNVRPLQPRNGRKLTLR